VTVSSVDRLVAAALAGRRIGVREALEHLPGATASVLLPAAAELAHRGHGRAVTYSRKVFVPLTRLCRDVCAYCTFATVPREVRAPYLSPEEVLEIARAGERVGCREALFTLGDRPEARYGVARRALAALGAASTVEYLERQAAAVLAATGLLPHLNAGVLDERELAQLRPHAASMGLMLESASERLCGRGGPHHGSPDKRPAVRLATLEAAGRLSIAMTTGILVGIGETRQERIEALLAIRDLHDRHGHVQDLIVQNFVPKPGTRMAAAPAGALEEQLWTNAVARLLFGPEISIQAPPNLRGDDLAALLESGINDWGGVSPVTPDHVNPESPWPAIAALEAATRASGRVLVERLALTPRHAVEAGRWTVPPVATRVRRAVDATGHVRDDAWFAGSGRALPPGPVRTTAAASRAVRAAVAAAARGALDETQAEMLFHARGADLGAVLAAADDLRREAVGDDVGYVVNRNINYTNVCTHRCGFCAFSKGRSAADLRGPGYRLDLAEIAARAVEAHGRGATEVCLQGGIHPSYTGATYLEILGAIREAAPDLHVHAFSPLEVAHGAASLGIGVEDYLRQLKRAGLGSLPGTAAEILDDEVRRVICPDKLTTELWLEIVGTAHRVGLKTTATMMFGHVDRPAHWARHLIRLRALQRRTGGFTEFVPLPYVHMEAPLWRRGATRSGPTLREALLVHAVARLALHGAVDHVQASWVKLGLDGLARCLEAGADDAGGTLMNESITRAAGGSFGQGVEAEEFEALARRLGRRPWQRTTLYRPVTSHVRNAAVAAVAASALG
jgi:FO synthase